MSRPIQDIVLLGAGNLATSLGCALKSAGLNILQVYSRTEASASALASRLACPHITDLSLLTTSCDLVVCALKDSVLEDVLDRIPDFGSALWVHTSGSLPVEIFASHTRRYGVFYPLQTFSRQKAVPFDHIPICLECASGEDRGRLRSLALRLSDCCREISSEQRSWLHLAAVFANNFSNAMLASAAELLAAHGLEFSLLTPLTEETVAKIRTCPPAEAQTGPAIRWDENILSKHLGMLEREGKKPEAELYRLISEAIHQRAISSVTSQNPNV